MSVFLECKKVRGTGFIPTFLIGGLLAAAVPIFNMTFRSESYLSRLGTPLQILLDANWRMMAMMNVLLIIIGACLMYHTEYADNAIQKMETLPIKERNMFFGKIILLAGMFVIVLFVEATSIAYSSLHWFGVYDGFLEELGKDMGYFFLLALPSIILSLLIASACKNMWVSLGNGVICLFTATTIMLPSKNFMLSLFPFAMPFQQFGGTEVDRVFQFICASMIELVVIGIAGILVRTVRRSFE